MRRLPRQIILTLCALLLLGAQQAAYTHLIGHLGYLELSGPAVAQQADTAGDAAALSLSHLCSSCLAISAVAAGAPLPVSLPAVVAAITGWAAGFELLQRFIPAAPPYLARAPPYTL